MSCDVGEATERLENENEVKQRKGWRMSCDVGEVTERLENENEVKQRKGWRMSGDVGEVTERLENELILQPFHHFTCLTAHSPILMSLLLRHRLFTYVTWRAAHGHKVIVSRIKSCLISSKHSVLRMFAILYTLYLIMNGSFPTACLV